MNGYWIIEDIWRDIKTYLFHNIKIHGKHLKNDKYIINFNKVMNQMPIKYIPVGGPRIVYQSCLKSCRCAKFLYRVAAPCTLSKRRYSLKYKLVIEHILIGESTKEQIREEYYRNLNHLSQMDQPENITRLEL